MVRLDRDDRRRLLKILEEMPSFADSQRARVLLIDAGLGELVLGMTIPNSAPSVIASEIVTQLAQYGRVDEDHEALALLLSWIVEEKLAGLEQQRALSALIERYGMLAPLPPPAAEAPSPAAGPWRGKEDDESVKEQIFGEDTLRPIAFLEEGLRAARAVAYIAINTPRGRWFGTGFLISDELLLTNNHVIPDPALLPNTVFRFNYQEDWQHNVLASTPFTWQRGGLFLTDAAFDYTLVELDGRPGAQFGWLKLSAQALNKGERVNIIQHPGGQPKQISLQNNLVEYVGERVAQYITSTAPGSSGSPVLNDLWEVVAIHHAGGLLAEENSPHRYHRNEGVLIQAIVRAWPEHLRTQLEALASSTVSK